MKLKETITFESNESFIKHLSVRFCIDIETLYLEQESGQIKSLTIPIVTGDNELFEKDGQIQSKFITDAMSKKVKSLNI